MMSHLLAILLENYLSVMAGVLVHIGCVVTYTIIIFTFLFIYHKKNIFIYFLLYVDTFQQL